MDQSSNCVSVDKDLIEPIQKTCELIKIELIKKHKVESLKSFECSPPLTNQCSKLQIFTGVNYVGTQVRVHRDFIPYLDETDRLAARCNINVRATSSFRSKIIGCREKAKYPPAPNGNHFVGFAVDFNLINKTNNEVCNNSCLKRKNPPEWTKCFTDGILSITGLFGNLRYGMAFINPDPGHFDVKIYESNIQLYLSIKNSLKDC